MSTSSTDGQQPVALRPDLTVAPHPDEKAPAARLRRSLHRTMRGRRVSRRAALRSLAIEQIHIGRSRPASTTSYTENVLRGLGKAAGDKVLGRTHRTVARRAGRADGLRAEQATLRTQAGYRRGDIVRHPDGGVRTVAATLDDQDALRAQISADIQAGSRRHRRLPAILRRVPLVVFVADALLLLYFFSGVTNVDWSSPLSAALAFAAMLAAMVTCISFAFFRLTGDRLQQYKNDAGTIPLRGLDEATTALGVVALTAIAVLAALMYFRMHAEVIDALGPQAGATAIIIGLTLATVSVLANTLVIAVHALDGSAESDRLEALGGAVHRPLHDERRRHERADSMEHQIAVLGRRSDRDVAKGITRAGHQRAAADRYIDAGRAVHQGTGPLSEPAVDPNGRDGVIGYRHTEATPVIDERALRLAQRHVHAPLDSAAQAASAPPSGELPSGELPSGERPADSGDQAAA